MASPYTLQDVGCYVDEVRGIYAVDRIVKIAEEHGMPTPRDCQTDGCPRCALDERTAADGSHTEWSRCEWSHEVEDDCDAYMNEHHGVDGAFWGRSEQGDWGLWPCEDDGE